MDLLPILLVCITLMVEASDLLAQSEELPKFLEVFKAQELRPGEHLSLKCMATGTPLPMITWLLDELPITELNGLRYGDYVTRDSNVISFVNISSVSTEHGGHWTCTARSQAASVRYGANIHVAGPPFVRLIPNMTLVAHQTIYLKCPVGGNYDEIQWEKNGVLLPDNHRQTLHTNGTLIVRELSRETDGGRYSCFAKYKGDISRRDFFITVREKPVIEPFVVPSLVHTGQRLSITCTVIRGDPPLTIKWLYNDRMIGDESLSSSAVTNSVIKVHHLTDYSSTLLFETLTKKQTGNYTCLAINDVGEDKHSTQMIIHEKPRWIIEPTDHIDLVEGNSVWVDCSATGFPAPNVQWKRAQSIKSEYRPIASSFQTQVYENGTLFIESVDKKDSGLYLCHVSNGIEPDLSKIIRIQVHIAARFKAKFRAETFARNHRALLVCDAVGERPITIEWNRDRQLIHPEHHSNRYAIKETVMNEGITSELVIESIDRSDSALYQCITSNAYGRDETSIQVIVQEPPDTPLDVKVDDITSRSVRVSWAPPFTGNSRITKYHIHLKENPTEMSQQKRNITIPGTETVWTISELLPNNMYSLNVAAVNALGISQSSLSINFQTEEEVPSDPPTHIKAHSNTSTTLKVSWKAPDNQINFGSIKGYYIGYKISGSSDVFIYKTLENSDNSIRCETVLKNLNKSTKYDIVVQAFNSKGAGPPSEPIKAETLFEDRPKTVSLNTIGVTSSSIELEWIRTPNDDNSVSEFIVDCKNSANYFKQMRFVSNHTSCVFEGLFCGTLYDLSVMGCNKVGCSERHQITVKTKGSTPQPPDKESLLSTINSTFVIINLSTFNDNGCALQHFELKYRLRATSVWTLYSNFIHSSQKSLLIDGLQSNSWYYIQITAYSQAGSSQAEYNFLTRTQHNYNMNADINEEAVILSDYKTSVLLEFEVILPLTLSGIVVVAVTLLVCVVIHRRHPNDTFHSSNTGRMSNGKQHILNGDNNSLNMCDMDNKTTASASIVGTVNRNAMNGTSGSEYQRPSQQHQKCIYFPTPYATTQIDDTLEYVDNTGTVRKVGDCGGQYATVKRMTPKMHPKSDLHIYSYAVNSQQMSATKEDSEALITYLVEPMGNGGGGSSSGTGPGSSYGPTPTHCCSFIDNNQTTKLNF